MTRNSFRKFLTLGQEKKSSFESHRRGTQHVGWLEAAAGWAGVLLATGL